MVVETATTQIGNVYHKVIPKQQKTVILIDEGDSCIASFTPSKPQSMYKNVTRLFGLFLSVKNHFRLLRLLVSNFFGRKRVSGQSDKLVICIKNIFTVQTRRQPTPMPFCRVDFPRFPITRRFSCCCTNRTRFGSLHYMAATTSYYVMLLFAICIKSGSCRFDRGKYPFRGKPS